jgi:phosphate-selective porin
MKATTTRGIGILPLLLVSAVLAEPLPVTDTAAVQDLLQRLDERQRQLDIQQQELEVLKRELRGELVRMKEARQAAAVAPPKTEPVVVAATAQSGKKREQGLELSGYGIVNYINRDWDTDQFAKDTFNLARFVLEMEYAFSDQWSFKAEIEFEHGGAGAALELDTQEEFGEFDADILKGGEIYVEQLYVAYRHRDWLNARFGHFIVPVGRTAKHHKPGDYFTVERSAADAAMLPLLWHESGVALFGTVADFSYELQVVNGLDSSGFSSANWVARGHQQKFEEARAEDLAFVARLDYQPTANLQIGGAFYTGNSANNRPKDDLNVDAWVTIVGLDGAWTPGDFIFRGQYLYGKLQNSHLVSEANRNLSNNLGAKRTPVAHESQSWFVEGGYDVLGLAQTTQKLIVFSRYDNYDSMFAVEGGVFKNPRWDRSSWTVGLNYMPLPSLVFKAEYNDRTLNIDELNREKTFALGVGFTY